MSKNNVIMRKIEEKDLPQRVDWINDQEVNKFLHFDLPVTLENTKKWFDKVKKDDLRFDGVFETDDDTPIGFGGLLKVNKKDKNAELYITIGNTKYWNKGYGEKCVNLILDHGFNKLKLEKIYVTTEEENIAACKLYEKSNFKYEGRLRRHQYSKNKGENTDLLMYGILRSEYGNK